MSELKVYRIYTRRDEGAWGYDPFAEPTDVELNDEQVYLKSEADKVIVEMKKACNSKDDWCLHTLKENRHHKSKRCLAMAWWCSAELGMLVSTWESKIKYYKRWQKRWLELAEKFKEAK